jgi:UDP-N-acetylglucosamine pyrophosphorylase
MGDYFPYIMIKENYNKATYIHVNKFEDIDKCDIRMFNQFNYSWECKLFSSLK